MWSISTVIIKPTKHCNAQCIYCAAPPEVNGCSEKWSIDDFKLYMDKLTPVLTSQAHFIWHGGEPMLMGSDWYWKAYEYAAKMVPEIKFSMQTNILGYESKRWKEIFHEVFQGRISTSYDPDEKNRLLHGSAETYGRVFSSRLEAMLDDGFYPLVIGTYDEAAASTALPFYEKVKAMGDRAPNLRFNYRYPAGRNSNMGELITPETYGKMLVDLYNRWIVDVPPFTITPLDEMFKKVTGVELHRCPWTNSCAGHFLSIEPNGAVYNCAEFADLGDEKYMFGNINHNNIMEMMESSASIMMERRKFILPHDCRSCPHFSECQGGCMRDSVLYDRGLGGKFYYCQSWKMVFSRIKESIMSGEADRALMQYNLNAETIRLNIQDRL